VAGTLVARGARRLSEIVECVAYAAAQSAQLERRGIAFEGWASLAEGWLCVFAVIDLFSRRGVGWSVSTGMKTQLAADAALPHRDCADRLLFPIARTGRPGWFGHGTTQRVILNAQVKPTDCDPEHVTIRQAA
jgi:hypothetical protein